VARIHVVEQGETMLTIAARYGVRAWRTIFDDPANAALKKKRKDPQVLYPGDQVTIPDGPADDGVAVHLDQRTELVRRRRDRQRLALTLSNVDWSPMANVEYTLSFASGELRGTTDAEGFLAAELPLNVDELQLEVGGIVFELRMGHLNPLEQTDDGGISGCQGRLVNLGYFDGEIDGKSSPELQRAIRRFQLQHDLPRTGRLDDATRAKLAEKHGC